MRSAKAWGLVWIFVLVMSVPQLAAWTQDSGQMPPQGSSQKTPQNSGQAPQKENPDAPSARKEKESECRILCRQVGELTKHAATAGLIEREIGSRLD